VQVVADLGEVTDERGALVLIMTTLITGATGQVGSRFGLRMLDRQESVRLL
jgi:hypothetical protein